MVIFPSGTSSAGITAVFEGKGLRPMAMLESIAFGSYYSAGGRSIKGT
jgi:hypothetical protein